MKARWSRTIVAAFVAMAACTGAENDGPGEEAAGELELALIGTGSNGTQYRLRQGEFVVSPNYYEYEDESWGGQGGDPYQATVLSTESDPDADRIVGRFLPGSYYVTFTSTDWYLEALTPSGPERVEESVLLSSRFVYAYIYDGRSTAVTYRFGVDGELIDFRSGKLEIGIAIERPEDHMEGGSGGIGEEPPLAGVGGMGGSG